MGRRSLHPPTHEGFARSRRLFERAVELDPAFAGGYAGLSFVESLNVVHHFVPNSPFIAGRAKALADKAISLDSAFAWAHMAQSWVEWIDGHRDAAIGRVHEALRLQPGDPDHRAYLANQLTMMGRAPEAIAHAEHAVPLNPKRPGVAFHFLAYANAMAVNSQTEIKMIDWILWSTYSQFTYAMLILALVQDGDLMRAKEAAQFALQRFPNMTTGFLASGVSLRSTVGPSQ